MIRQQALDSRLIGLIDANVPALVHGRHAAIAGIKMVLPSLAFHKFIPGGTAKTFGGGLVGLELVGHTPLEMKEMIKSFTVVGTRAVKIGAN